MKIVRALYRNFRGHVSTDVTFPDGITLVVGPNGAGKTSLFEGILWALYGSYEVRTNMDAVRYWKAEKGEPCHVEVWMRSGDTEYIVRRSLSGATVELNGEEVADGQTGVSEYVENLVGMSREEFRETYFTEQKSLEVLKGSGPTDRARFYNRVMRFDVVREAEKAARSDKNDTAHRVEVVRARLDALPDVTPEDAFEAADALATANDRVGMAELEVDAAKSTLKGAELKRDKLAEARERVESLREDLTKASRDASVARERLSAGREALEEAEEAQTALEGLERRIRELEPRARERLEKIDGLKSRANEIRGTIRALKSRRESVLEQAESVEKIGPDGKCWTCGRGFDADAFGGAVSHLSEEAHDLNRQVEGLRDELREVHESIDRLEEDPDDPVAELEQAKADAYGPRQRAAKLDAINERLEKRERELEEAESRHDEVLSKINDASFDQDAWNEASARVTEASNALSDARVKLSEAKAEAKAARKHKEETKEAVKKRLASESELEALTGELDTLEDVDRFLGDLRGYLNDRLRPELSEVASDILSSMTGGMFTALELDEDFALRLYMGNIEVHGESGGEEDVAALAMRIATSQLVSERHGEGFGTLKLDEVFAHVDSVERIPLVMQELRKLVETGRFPQVILIEHREEVKQYADHVIEVTRDERTKRSYVNMVFGDDEEGHNMDLPAAFDTAAD